MITITETATRIGCSRTTIYAALKRLDIKPHKHKRKSLLDDEQIALVQESLPGDSTHSAGTTSNDKQPEPIRQKIAPSYDPQPLLVEQLQAEVNHLKALLGREQVERSTERTERADERKAERERAERHDALVTALLSEQKVLRDEVQRLKALQAPGQVEEYMASAEGSDYATDFERSSERTERSFGRPDERGEHLDEHDTAAGFAEATLPPETVVSNGSWGGRLTAFGLIGTTMVVIAFFIAINNPDLVLSKAIISLWQ
jgi:hypothetical protein